VSSNLSINFIFVFLKFFFIQIWSFKTLNIGSKFYFYMIQVQKHKNWSKYHLKLQKEPKIFMMGNRWYFFRFLKILKFGLKNHILRFSDCEFSFFAAVFVIFYNFSVVSISDKNCALLFYEFHRQIPKSFHTFKSSSIIIPCLCIKNSINLITINSIHIIEDGARIQFDQFSTYY
jgi:hypothetical protein